jgi:hypothetical protein
MVNVEIISDFFVAATSSHYFKGWIGEVSNEIAERHGKEGTGMLELSDKPSTPIEPKVIKPAKKDRK